MTANLTPWQAEPDTFAISRPADEFIDAFEKAGQQLTFASEDSDCKFFAEVRSSKARKGPAIVVTDIAEYRGRARQTAVVVSAVVFADHHEDRMVVIRTHLEDQHTRYEGDQIVFDEHHRAMRAAMSEAVLEVEPGAEHRTCPARPGAATEAQAPGAIRANTANAPSRALAAAERPQTPVARTSERRVDPRQAAGIALLAIGVIVLLVAIAAESLYPIIGAVGVAGLLGYVGNRIAGV